MLTLVHEKDLFWKRQWSAATWLFFFNRYLLVVYALLSYMAALPSVDDMVRYVHLS